MNASAEQSVPSAMDEQLIDLIADINNLLQDHEALFSSPRPSEIRFMAKPRKSGLLEQLKRERDAWHRQINVAGGRDKLTSDETRVFDILSTDIDCLEEKLSTHELRKRLAKGSHDLGCAYHARITLSLRIQQQTSGNVSHESDSVNVNPIYKSKAQQQLDELKQKMVAIDKAVERLGGRDKLTPAQAAMANQLDAKLAQLE